MTSISGMSTETRLFNLIPDTDEFKKKPFYQSQRPSTAGSQRSFSTIQQKNTKNNYNNNKIPFSKKEISNIDFSERSDINSKFKLPQGLVNEMTYRQKTKQNIDQHQYQQIEKNPYKNFKTHERGCNKVPEDHSNFSNECKHKKPPVPKHNDHTLQQNGTQQFKLNNFIEQNQFNMGNNLTRTQNLQILNKKEKEQQQQREQQILKEKFGKVPDYLQERQFQEQKEYYKLHQQHMMGKTHQKLQSFNNIQDVRQKKAKLKKQYDDLMVRYQAKYGHKSKIDLKKDRDEKQSMELQFLEMEKEIKQLQKYEQQNQQFLDDTKSMLSGCSKTFISTFTAFQRKQEEINEHDAQHNKKLQQKKENYNYSQNHRFAPVKRK